MTAAAGSTPCESDRICFYSEANFGGQSVDFSPSFRCTEIGIAAKSVHNNTGEDVVLYTKTGCRDYEITIRPDSSRSVIDPPARSFKSTT